MKKNFGLGLVAVAAIGFVGCGATKQDAKNVTNDKVQESKLMATYKTECQNMPFDLLNLESRKVEYTFSGHLDKTTTYYSTDDCQDEVLVIHTTGKYENFDRTEADANIYRLDITMTDTKVTAKTDDIKNALNAIPGGYCGVKEWAVNEAREVTGAADKLNCPGTEELGQTSYDIVSVQNNELKFGLAVPVIQDKTSPEKRPKALSPEVVARK